MNDLTSLGSDTLPGMRAADGFSEIIKSYYHGINTYYRPCFV